MLRLYAHSRRRSFPTVNDFNFGRSHFTPSKTYYVDGANGNDGNPGSHDRPFETINQAAQALQPGERAVIASGVCREAIQPARGGTGPDKLISYEAAPGANVVISGAQVGNAWGPSSGFGSRRNISADIPGEINPHAVHIEASAKTNEIDDILSTDYFGKTTDASRLPGPG